MKYGQRDLWWSRFTARHFELDDPGGVIRHPVIVTLLILWVVNDHILKSVLANTFTGKLSDVTSLAVFPLLPYCIYEIVWALRGKTLRHAHLVLGLSITATAAVMIGINISESWAEAYRVGLGAAQWPFRCLWSIATGDGFRGIGTVKLTMDPTDLWTLPAVLIPWRITRNRHRPNDAELTGEPSDL